MLKNIEVTSLESDNFHVKVGAVNFQIDRVGIELLVVKLAAAVNSRVIEDEELQKVFAKFDALNLPSTPKLCNANANSSKGKPLGK